MRAVFLGTPASAIPSLAALVDVADIGMVITQPDRARGRSGKPVPPPIKTAATEWGLPVAQPETKRALDETLTAVGADVGIIVAYGRILSADALASVPVGFFNIHFSLLPRWRGAAPVERAILAGDEATGVTLMQLDEGLDTGPVLAAVETPIGPDETGGSLTGRLSYLGAMLIDDTVPDLLAGRIEPAPQLRTGVTIANRLERSEGRIEPSWSAEYAERAVRAFMPRPGAWFLMDGARYNVQRASLCDESISPGVLTPVGGRPVLGLDDGSITIEEVQPAGKSVMTGTAWMNGRRGAGGVIEASEE